MNIEDIKKNEDLVKKLNGLHRSLTVLMKDNIHYDKFSYKDHEVNIGIDAKAVNQRIAENRRHKIRTLISLSENWDAFKTLYKDDIILKKIGVEFLEGKFEFNKEIIDTIKEYPHRNELLYYFVKGEKVDLGGAVPEDYERIKNQILPEIQENAITHLHQKKSLMIALRKIIDDKSQSNINYISKLTDDSNTNGTMNVNYSQGISEILNRVMSGDFIAQQVENQIVVEVPIAGVYRKNGSEVKSSTVLFKVDLTNPKDYSIEVGNLQQLNTNLAEKINAIREKALKTKDKDISIKIR